MQRIFHFLARILANTRVNGTQIHPPRVLEKKVAARLRKIRMWRAIDFFPEARGNRRIRTGTYNT